MIYMQKLNLLNVSGMGVGLKRMNNEVWNTPNDQQREGMLSDNTHLVVALRMASGLRKICDIQPSIIGCQPNEETLLDNVLLDVVLTMKLELKTISVVELNIINCQQNKESGIGVEKDVRRATNLLDCQHSKEIVLDNASLVVVLKKICVVRLNITDYQPTKDILVDNASSFTVLRVGLGSQKISRWQLNSTNSRRIMVIQRRDGALSDARRQSGNHRQ
jgi:hypothetical protein